MITPAFRLGLRFCKALPAPCVEGFERRASAWCRTGGTALGRTPRSCVLARFLPRLFRMRCYLLVSEDLGIHSGSWGPQRTPVVCYLLELEVPMYAGISVLGLLPHRNWCFLNQSGFDYRVSNPKLGRKKKG